MSQINLKTRETLLNQMGKRVSFDEIERKIYAHDMGVMPSMVKPLIGNPVPDGIVQPVSEAEMVDLVRLAMPKISNLLPGVRLPLVTVGYYRFLEG